MDVTAADPSHSVAHPASSGPSPRKWRAASAANPRGRHRNPFRRSVTVPAGCAPSRSGYQVRRPQQLCRLALDHPSWGCCLGSGSQPSSKLTRPPSRMRAVSSREPVRGPQLQPHLCQVVLAGCAPSHPGTKRAARRFVRTPAEAAEPLPIPNRSTLPQHLDPTLRRSRPQLDHVPVMLPVLMVVPVNRRRPSRHIRNAGPVQPRQHRKELFL